MRDPSTVAFAMLVSQVASRRMKREFVALPHRLHGKTALWVPPLRREVGRLLDRRHPFRRHSDASFFLAERDGRAVARIGVHDNTPFNEAHGTRWAFFHLLDAEDGAAGRAMLETAATWAADRGLERIVGPMGFLPGDAMGVMVDGFDQSGSMTTPWNPPSYPAMLEDAGFVKETDYLSGMIDRPLDAPPGLLEAADAAAEAVGLSIKNFDSRRELRRWVHRIGEVHNAVFTENWEYRPITPAEMTDVARRFVPIADPRLIVLLMEGERVVGFLFILPDGVDGLRRAGGRLLPLGWWHILRAAQTSPTVHFQGFGVLPEFHGTAANAIIYAHVVRRAGTTDYRAGRVTQVEEGNTRMHRNLEALGVVWTTRHRVFGRPVTRGRG